MFPDQILDEKGVVDTEGYFLCFYRVSYKKQCVASRN